MLSAVSLRVGPDADFVELLVRLRNAGADVVSVNSFPATRGEPGVDRVLDVEFRDLDGEAAAAAVRGALGVSSAEPRPTLGQIFGKRVIIIGGGAQVAQVSLGAVTESDRHNLRGERISVDTIALVGEKNIANDGACRRGPAACPHPGACRLDHGRRDHRGRAGAAGDRHPGHLAQHGRLRDRRSPTSS